MKISGEAKAKINLSLDLTGKLPDGYHAITTIMTEIALSDTVSVETGECRGIKIECACPGVPCDEKNTAYKAASYFFEAAEISPSAIITIEKNIPHEAGLAGGSADAAAVLRFLNEFFPGKVSEKKLFEIALRVGADVPFCLKGGTALCMNRGEVMAELPPFEGCVLLAKPSYGVSTKLAFERFDSAEKLIHPKNDDILFYASKGDYKKALEGSLNIFEQLCDIPEGDFIKESMLSSGAYYASLSGSGSCFYGLFDSPSDGAKAEQKLEGRVDFLKLLC